jgi:hypothetical protein
MNLYDELAFLRDQLTDLGQNEWAAVLLSAERSATTSGEAIANLTPILKNLLMAELGDGSDIKAKVQTILAFVDRAWDESNRWTPEAVRENLLPMQFATIGYAPELGPNTARSINAAGGIAAGGSASDLETLLQILAP